MKYIFKLLLITLFLASCSEKLVPPSETERGILYGKLVLTIPKIFENGAINGSISYTEELDGIQIETRYDGNKDSVFSKKGWYFLNKLYGSYFIFYKIRDSISGYPTDMAYRVNMDSVQVIDCNITPIYNSNSGLFKLQYPVPNPAVSTFVVDFTISEDGFCDMDLYNVNGKLIKKVFADSVKKGTYTVQYQRNDEKAGIYFVFARFNGKAYSYSSLYLKEW